MDRAHVAGKLKAFLETQCRIAVPAADAMLDIDSFNMMLVITFADDELGASLSMDSMDFDAMPSLDTLTDLIVSELGSGA